MGLPFGPEGENVLRHPADALGLGRKLAPEPVALPSRLHTRRREGTLPEGAEIQARMGASDGERRAV